MNPLIITKVINVYMQLPLIKDFKFHCIIIILPILSIIKYLRFFYLIEPHTIFFNSTKLKFLDIINSMGISILLRY